MRSKIILLLSLCALLAACATEDVKVTGITRHQATEIAKENCKEYPDRYGYIDSAEWLAGAHYWVVRITDYRGGRGKLYKINRSGKVIDVEKIGSSSGGGDDYDDHPYRHYGWWY